MRERCKSHPEYGKPSDKFVFFMAECHIHGIFSGYIRESAVKTMCPQPKCDVEVPVVYKRPL